MGQQVVDYIRDSQQVVAGVFHSFRSQLLDVTGAIEFESKEDSSPVTKWDIALENTLKEALLGYDETVGFRGEETGSSGDSQRYWIVDPIDGTAGFIRGFDYATNMAAYVENGVVLASVIYDFYRDLTYTAVRGQGAFRNGERLSINSDRQSGNLIVYSFSPRHFARIQEALTELDMRAVLPLGHSGHSYVLLAEGKIDGVITIGTHTALHDNAPGVLLCEEAGAQVVSYDDKQGVERQQFVIGSPYVVQTVEESGFF